MYGKRVKVQNICSIHYGYGYCEAGVVIVDVCIIHIEGNGVIGGGGENGR